MTWGIALIIVLVVLLIVGLCVLGAGEEIGELLGAIITGFFD